jgi:hypothetical protein
MFTNFLVLVIFTAACLSPETYWSSFVIGLASIVVPIMAILTFIMVIPKAIDTVFEDNPNYYPSVPLWMENLYNVIFVCVSLNFELYFIATVYSIHALTVVKHYQLVDRKRQELEG